ncbi:YcnI family copper-binding membrane protein [Pararoseomonas indoligenes]|uniref:YcnI family protein n=1 Tax=Roseomonas indoligenes TaxID=2820811 RepID=A0A940S5U7_9PROT|nr:YcnI family protein [Pararoseomonas indoligenes]MBP0491248.1 YcnI family protein [Pararoseomonas indoligenes]
MTRLLIGLSVLGALISGAALAHVTVDQPTLPADSYVRIAIRVPHGCEGAATTGIRLQVPPELRGAKAMPVAGWALTTRMEGGVTVQGEHGTAHVPREVSWQGGNLPDDQYQEFVLLVRTPAEPGATLYFPVVQDCEGGKVSRWIERPSAPGERLRYPAYSVRITPKG